VSSVTVTATPEPGNVPPRVRLNITDTGTPAVTAVTPTRLNPDGSTVPVRTYDGNPLTLTSGTGLLYDYEMPYGAPVSYSTIESPTLSSAQVAVGVADVWLVHPGVPALSQPIRVIAINERVRKAQRGVHFPMGRRGPVVQTDGQRKSAAYTLTIRTNTDSARAAIDNLLDDASVLLLNVPATKGWGVTAEYVSVGDSTEARFAPYGSEQRRTWDLPVLVVDRPVGGSQAQRTLLDLLDYPTLNSLAAAYSTLNALLAGP